MHADKALKHAFKLNQTMAKYGTKTDVKITTDLLGEVIKLVDENVMLHQQLSYTEAKTK